MVTVLSHNYMCSTCPTRTVANANCQTDNSITPAMSAHLRFVLPVLFSFISSLICSSFRQFLQTFYDIILRSQRLSFDLICDFLSQFYLRKEYFYERNDCACSERKALKSQLLLFRDPKQISKHQDDRQLCFHQCLLSFADRVQAVA